MERPCEKTRAAVRASSKICRARLSGEERRHATAPVHADNYRLGTLAVPAQANTGEEGVQRGAYLGIWQRIEPSLAAPTAVSLPNVGDLDAARARRAEHGPRIAIRLFCGVPRRRRMRHGVELDGWCVRRAAG